MSDAQNQGEPTMEEILASIRKIISEDGTPEDGEAPEEGAAAEAAPDAAPEEPAEAAAEAPPAPTPDEPEEAAAAAPAEPEPAAEADEDDDVLDLTKMVGEDGDVVDLADAEEEVAAAPPPTPEPAEETDDFDTDGADEIPDLIAIESEDAAEPAPQPEPEPAPQPDIDSLLAGTTQAAVTSSLSAVATAVGPHDAAAGVITGDSKTLEMLVREVMEPYLKSWLDENLAGMVERIVRDEVQKMARRAEYR